MKSKSLVKRSSAWFSLIAVSVVSSTNMIPIGIADFAHNRAHFEVRAGTCSRSKTTVQRQAKGTDKTPRPFRWLL